MQKQVTDAFVFLPVPTELMKEARINVVLPLQFDVSKGKLIVENVKDVGKFVCDGDCGGCPMSEMEYSNNGKCKYNRKKRGEAGV